MAGHSVLTRTQYGKLSPQVVGRHSCTGSRREGVGKEKEKEEGTLRRLLYWPGSSTSWSSLTQSYIPNTPGDMLSTLASDSDFDSGTSLTLFLGDPERTRLSSSGSDSGSDAESQVGEKRGVIEVNVDYVRIYQAMKLPLGAEATRQHTAVRDEYAVLDLLEI